MAGDLYKQQYDRMKRIPSQIEAAERKVAMLYKEAKRYKMKEVLSRPAAVNSAWDREVLLAQIEAAERGEETSIGIDNL